MKYELFHSKNLWYMEALGENGFHAMADFSTKKAAMAAYKSWQEMWGEGELTVVKTNEERTFYQWQKATDIFFIFFKNLLTSFI